MDTTLLGLASVFQGMVRSMPLFHHDALERAAVVVETEAKRVIGTYDYGWEQLHDATKEDRVTKGFPENEPGLRTGEMRDSIEHVSNSHDATIGSNSDKLVWFEVGTTNQSPRPVLQGALHDRHEEVVHIVGQRVLGKFFSP